MPPSHHEALATAYANLVDHAAGEVTRWREAVGDMAAKALAHTILAHHPNAVAVLLVDLGSGHLATDIYTVVNPGEDEPCPVVFDPDLARQLDGLAAELELDVTSWQRYAATPDQWPHGYRTLARPRYALDLRKLTATPEGTDPA